jgi:hypothetical protein
MMTMITLTTIVRLFEAYSNFESPLFIPGNLPKYFSLMAATIFSAPNLISSMISGVSSFAYELSFVSFFDFADSCS